MSKKLGLRGMDPAALDRTRQIAFAGATQEIVGREDLVAMKAFAGGPVDQADARAVIDLDRKSLDLALLRRLAQRFGSRRPPAHLRASIAPTARNKAGYRWILSRS